MTDVIAKVQKWFDDEPNQTEIIIIRKEDGQFAAFLHYGNRVMIPRSSSLDNLADALEQIIDRAIEMPSGPRKKRLIEALGEPNAIKKRDGINGVLVPEKTGILPGL